LWTSLAFLFPFSQIDLWTLGNQINFETQKSTSFVAGAADCIADSMTPPTTKRQGTREKIKKPSPFVSIHLIVTIIIIIIIRRD
jgi:hypothetical protein